MSTSLRIGSLGALCSAITLALISTLLAYSAAHAQVSTAANATCVACVAEAQSKKQDPHTYCKPRTCIDSTNGITKGHCELVKCHADSFSGAGGSGAAGLDQVAKILGDLMGKLMQGKQGDQQSSSPLATTSTNGMVGCTQYVQVSDASQLIGNPCATYVPPVSSQINGGSALSEALDSTSGVDLSATLIDNINNTNDSANENTGVQVVAEESTDAVPSGAATLVPSPGVSGDIQVLDTGVTVVAGTRDANTNTEVAGFYGSGTLGIQSTGLVGQWCQTRPWATNFLSVIVPASFFDSICTWRGYPVGAPPAQQTPSLQQKVVPAATATTTQPLPATNVPTVPPKVDIWAVPAEVPLGARTTIYWNTQGVTNCSETSPDGSFSHTSLSGGAATVPITGSTTFTISCDAPDGSHLTSYVTVGLSI